MNEEDIKAAMVKLVVGTVIFMAALYYLGGKVS